MTKGKIKIQRKKGVRDKTKRDTKFMLKKKPQTVTAICEYILSNRYAFFIRRACIRDIQQKREREREKV